MAQDSHSGVTLFFGRFKAMAAEADAAPLILKSSCGDDTGAGAGAGECDISP
jgi:hypothetical protein